MTAVGLSDAQLRIWARRVAPLRNDEGEIPRPRPSD